MLRITTTMAIGNNNAKSSNHGTGLGNKNNGNNSNNHAYRNHGTGLGNTAHTDTATIATRLATHWRAPACSMRHTRKPGLRRP